MNRMRPRRWSIGGFLAALALLATVAGCGDDVTPTPPAASDGLEFGSAVNPEEFPKAAGALPPEALADPPGSLPAPGASSTLEFLPAIATQGTPATLGVPGTCEAQSFAYGLGSYSAARGADGFSIKWDPGQPGNAVSAAYQFALAVSDGFATCPKGGTATQYLGRLASFGSPTVADVLSKGYTYLRRTDGSAFLPGRYAVTVKAQTLAGASVTYTGTVDVAGPLPATPPAASMTSAASAGKLFDSLGSAPQIATGP